MTQAITSSPGAARARNYRRRRRRGMMCLTIRVSLSELELPEARGNEEAAKRTDREALARAVESLISDELCG